MDNNNKFYFSTHTFNTAAEKIHFINTDMIIEQALDTLTNSIHTVEDEVINEAETGFGGPETEPLDSVTDSDHPRISS